MKSIDLLKSKGNARFNDIHENASKNVILIKSIREQELESIFAEEEKESIFAEEEEQESIFAEEIKINSAEHQRPARSKRISNELKSTQNLSTEKKSIATTKKQKTLVKGYCKICCYFHPNSHRHTIQSHSKELLNGTFTCFLCERICQDVHELLQHIEASHNEYEYHKKCTKCDFVTKIREDFVRHVEKCYYGNKKRAYVCSFCDDCFCREAKSKHHNRIHFGALNCR